MTQDVGDTITYQEEEYKVVDKDIYNCTLLIERVYAGSNSVPKSCSHVPLDTGSKNSWCIHCDRNLAFVDWVWKIVDSK